MKQTDAGLRKKRISLLSDMVMQTAPISIRKRLNMAAMAVATFRSAGEAQGDASLAPSPKSSLSSAQTNQKLH